MLGRAARHVGRCGYGRRVASYSFTAELYLWKSRPESWVLLSLPQAVSDDIEERLTDPPRGFGSVRVQVRIGRSEWSTSIFPSKELATYVLPVKRQVLEAEALAPADTTMVHLSPVAQTSAASEIE
jgi:hypothetical protein